MSEPRVLDGLLRELAPQVLGALVRRYGQFDAAEDATQEALLAAALQWPREGVPGNPRSWLISVATRRLVDEFRSDSARRRREAATVLAESRSGTAAGLTAGAEDGPDTEARDRDDTLALLFLCAHPSLSPPSQLALTLRAVGGLTTGEIAAAFLVPEATMAQRISRAKQSIRRSGQDFPPPAPGAERAERLRVVRQVLYLIFNEGYTASGGPELQRAELTGEAVRLARMLHGLVPGDHETAGLLALMLLTDARRDARTTAGGELVPLDQQDRSRWSKEKITEGVALVSATLGRGPIGPYQVQAAIAALHDEAASDGETDWAQILALYEVLERISPGPIVTLNRAVAVARTQGPLAGLTVLGDLAGDERMAGNHRLAAVRAHLLEQAGFADQARDEYLAAAKLTTSAPERRYLTARAAGLQR
ncbi:RNA polymerase sigma factor [Paractinoplanes lichenicola]|uniref:Sigma-70 family RNA polymerase sigma factor n=1 Tax=Paractinoplanes lichenicola TaxID=2802976 RepID=A0ABS1VJ69_9ACTN|nr:sigma-70 family RNA polymerase sigma factor [Actinoplanes lichenicola]MBL7254340.1 sigma-70 family RNA polymerase sigma factor [Actinoplanes lichenicola]